jgi:hypothetical protein
MAKRRNIKQEITDALIRHPDGLTMLELGVAIKADYETVRVTLQRNRPQGVYISEWVRVSKGPHSAVYKMVNLIADSPRPPRSTHDVVVERSRVTPTKAAPAPINHKPQGMTQIRGPWPTFH